MDTGYCSQVSLTRLAKEQAKAGSMYWKVDMVDEGKECSSSTAGNGRQVSHTGSTQIGWGRRTAAQASGSSCLLRIPRARTRPILACSVVVSSNAATLVRSLQPARLSRWIHFRTRVGGHHTCLPVPGTSHKARTSTTMQGEKSLDACSLSMRRPFLPDSPENYCPNLPVTLS